ncbi:Hypothetical predicted protein, partial [Marmota monax]
RRQLAPLRQEEFPGDVKGAPRPHSKAWAETSHGSAFVGGTRRRERLLIGSS